MGPASAKAELDMGEPLHLAPSSNFPDVVANKEGGVGTAMATNGHEPDTINASSNGVTKFDPGWRFYLAFSSLAVLAMMVSLDGTSVSVALPVRLLFFLRLRS